MTIKWQHVLVEAERSHREGLSIYLNGERTGVLMQDTAVSDNVDFKVGRSDNSYFSGSLDFLRISRGSLAEAETSIEELYAREFN